MAAERRKQEADLWWIKKRELQRNRVSPAVTVCTAVSTPSASAMFPAPAAAFAFGPGFVHIERTAAQLRSVKRGNSFLPVLGICHLHKAKATRTARVPIGHNAHTVHLPVGLEELAQLVFRRIEAEIPDEDILQASRP